MDKPKEPICPKFNPQTQERPWDLCQPNLNRDADRVPRPNTVKAHCRGRFQECDTYKQFVQITG